MSAFAKNCQIVSSTNNLTKQFVLLEFNGKIFGLSDLEITLI